MSSKSDVITEDVKGYEFSTTSVRECKYPAVIKRYGHGGICHVSVYTCMKCKFAVRVPFCGGVKCGYESEENNEQER